MYSTFNLKIDLTDLIFFPSENFIQYTKTGCERKEFVKSSIGKDLKNYINSGVIDGTKLSDEWFKTIKVMCLFLIHMMMKKLLWLFLDI